MSFSRYNKERKIERNDNHATTNCHEITKPHFFSLFFFNVPKHVQENEKDLANQPKSAKSRSNNLCVHTLIKVRF